MHANTYIVKRKNHAKPISNVLLSKAHRTLAEENIFRPNYTPQFLYEKISRTEELSQFLCECVICICTLYMRIGKHVPISIYLHLYIICMDNSTYIIGIQCRYILNLYSINRISFWSVYMFSAVCRIGYLGVCYANRKRWCPFRYT